MFHFFPVGGSNFSETTTDVFSTLYLVDTSSANLLLPFGVIVTSIVIGVSVVTSGTCGADNLTVAPSTVIFNACNPAVIFSLLAWPVVAVALISTAAVFEAVNVEKLNFTHQ